MPADLLAGIRVVEIGQYIPAPFAGLALADLGAEVVKIEPPSGDPMRRFGETRAGGVSAAYTALNGGKRIIRPDLKTPAVQQQVRALVAAADVLLESFRPGVLDRLGLGRQALAEANPRLVHCALSGFGQNGPLSRKAAHDLNYMAAGGGLAGSGTTERPVITRPPVSDYAGGQQAALSIAAALFRRERTGRGAYIDIAMADVVLSWQAADLAESASPIAPARGADLIGGGAAGYNIYRAACGGFVTLAALEARFWQVFCHAVRRADLIDRQADPLPQTALIAELAALFAKHTALEWEDRLGALDCCFQRVLTPAEALLFPQFLAREILDGPDGDMPGVRYPAWIDGAPARSRREPWRDADLGQVLSGWS
ncbi:CaiB/BaiF CoA transferase family protein [Ancylobacter oerskovii]|uniref:CaiB/BaiF CoA transferase family protein n=1 Tax=Ancylobacter oerskovii TaxID=459519 RepID=A0ABW4Z2V7_9HYPH|nr:CoA transferase [Ancylobacter oerskovii]MBS7546200.1 CoA transferase [Ancylobacter oerskovii]